MTVSKHYNSVDGLRGVAILLVMWVHFTLNSHTNVGWMNALASFGSTGVDLFFVISGFLITGILIDSKNQPGYFKNFYARRVLRIFPLYYGFLFCFIVVIPLVNKTIHLNDQAMLDRLVANQTWYWTYLSNFLFYRQDGGQIVFFHLWSLSVEEQFYIVWPVIVYFLSSRSLTKICLFLIVTSLLLRAYFVLIHPMNEIFIWSFTFCRLDAISIGALIAIIQRQQISRLNLLRGMTGLGIASAVIVVVIAISDRGFFWNHIAVQTIGLSSIDLLYGTVLWFCVNTEGQKFASILSNKYLRTAGKYSYSLYMFHELVMQKLIFHVMPVIEQHLQLSRITRLLLVYCVGFSVSFVVAYFSWELFEKHFLKLKDAFVQKKDLSSLKSQL